MARTKHTAKHAAKEAQSNASVMPEDPISRVLCEEVARIVSVSSLGMGYFRLCLKRLKLARYSMSKSKQVEAFDNSTASQDAMIAASGSVKYKVPDSMIVLFSKFGQNLAADADPTIAKTHGAYALLRLLIVQTKSHMRNEVRTLYKRSRASSRSGQAAAASGGQTAEAARAAAKPAEATSSAAASAKKAKATLFDGTKEATTSTKEATTSTKKARSKKTLQGAKETALEGAKEAEAAAGAKKTLPGAKETALDGAKEAEAAAGAKKARAKKTVAVMARVSAAAAPTDADVPPVADKAQRRIEKMHKRVAELRSAGVQPHYGASHGERLATLAQLIASATCT